MKYIIALFLLTNLLIAQDHEPAQRPFNLFGNSNYYIDPDTSSYFNTDNEILLGWQWDEIDSFQFNIQNQKSQISNRQSQIANRKSSVHFKIVEWLNT